MKTSYWKEAVEVYARRLSRFRRLEVCEVKDADAAQDTARRRDMESARLLEALTPQDRVVVLDERGRDLTSVELAGMLSKWDAQGQGRTTFVLGGPFGFLESVRQRANFVWRLSALTLPHELARVVLMEQLYRAESLRANVPYHH